MADNVIPGAEVFRFKDLELHGNLVSASYTRHRRIAVHEFLKRDGGQTEDMGREPFRVQIAVTFVGDDFRAQLTALAASLDRDPNGRFVDPLFGEFPATCEGFDRALLDIDRAVNAITVPLSFIENNVDARLSASQSRGASTAAQSVTEGVTTFDEVVADFTSAATACAALSDAATDYAAAALDSVIESSIDPSLTTRLGLIAGLTEAAQAALVLSAGSDVLAYDAIVASEMVSAACVDLQQAILDSRPPMGRYTVPTLTHIAALAQYFYGIGGLSRIDEILANNPDLGNPAAIPGGTVLVMAQPTV